MQTDHDHHVKIAIEVDGVVYFAHRHELTGREIKHLAHRPEGNTLYRLKGTERIKVRDDETIRIHEHEAFITVPPVGHAS